MAQVFYIILAIIALYALFLYFRQKKVRAGLVGVVAIVIGVGGFFPYVLKDSTDIIVSKTEVKPNGTNLIYTRNHGTYEIRDNIWYMQYRSSDLFGKLLDGNKYSIKYYGIRLPYFSAYPNIYSVSLLEDNNVKKEVYYQSSTDKMNELIEQNRRLIRLNEKILERLEKLLTEKSPNTNP